MPQVKSQFTPEQKLAFETQHNLWVYSHEAIIEVLMQQDSWIQQLEERIMEVAENIVFEIYEEWEVFRESLADKWK